MSAATKICECGRGPVVSACGGSQLPQDDLGCRDCNAIDGTTDAQRQVIHLLRISDAFSATFGDSVSVFSLRGPE